VAVVKGAHNSFETGVADGTTITVGNSDDGDEHHPFSAVTVVGTGAEAKYATTSPVPHEGLGALSAHFGIPGAAETKEANVSFDYTATEWWWRAYFYIPAAPGMDYLLVAVHDDADNVITGVRLSTADDELRLIDANDVEVASAVTAFPIAAWFRLEGHVIHDAAEGRHELRVYEDPDADAEDYQLGAYFINTGGGSEVSRVSWGIHEVATGAAYDLHVDAIAWTDEGWIGRSPIEHLPPTTTFLGVTL
jgi:hypothetical protein